MKLIRSMECTGLANLPLFVAALAALQMGGTAATPRAWADSVSNSFPTNLWIGSGGLPHTQGMTFPGATRPFGMVRLSPDTRAGHGIFSLLPVPSGAHSAGYRYGHDILLGFSHNRLSGTGVRDGGVFRVLPVSDLRDFTKRNSAVTFENEDEKAEPGYYRINLPRLGVTAELTASVHCGFHRYTRQDQHSPLNLLVDVTSSLYEKPGKPNGRVKWDPIARSLEGESTTYGAFASRQGGVKAFFYAEYSAGVEKGRLWQGRNWLPTTGVDGSDIGVALEASASAPNVELALCMSYVSTENARLNFEAEARGRSFEEAHDESTRSWLDRLGHIVVQTDNYSLKRVFNTMHYFASLMPTQTSDVNGEYLGFGGIVGHADDFIYRTDMSLWDTFRTTHPLFTLVAPDVQRDSLRSLLKMSEAKGVFPRWPFAAADSGSMFGLPAHFLFSESWLKGIRDFDAHQALAAMVRGATDDDYSREAPCRALGYCPGDLIKKWSVSKTLENAWSDHAVSIFAASLGQATIAQQFADSSQAFRNLWDPSRRYFRPRDSKGKFMRFSPSLLSYLKFLGKGTEHYAEGSAQQWRYSVPHDAPALIELFGGPKNFVKELNSFMKGAMPGPGFFYPGAKYWHGNQPDLHVTYLFNEAGRPDLTQKWARWALRTRYADKPGGFDGNDDGGTLSAWFVLSALGIYPQAGTDLYWIGSPALTSAHLDLGAGHSLDISTRNQHPKHPYVQALWRNGKRWCKPSISHAELRDAHLEFDLGPKPAPGGGYDCQAGLQ